MIRNQWYVVLESKELRKNNMLGVTRMGEKMVFYRNSRGEAGCMLDRCAHRGVALSAGKIVHDHVQCPFHGFEYDTEGRCRLIPANGKKAAVPEYIRVPSYPVREAHGFIYIFWGDSTDNLPEIPFFDDIDDSFTYGTLVDHWSTHYSRAIENQLDVVHLPFVHHNTIGRGNRTLVHGPAHAETDSMLQIWVHNVKDDGNTLPIKPDALKPGSLQSQHLHFIFPNIWQNYITPRLRVMAAFVPVDSENMLFYIRFYQNFLKLPGLSHLVNYLGSLMNKVIERQDRRVVITQQPKRSRLKMEEKLVQGDLPVIVYRKLREELIKIHGDGEKR